MSKPTIKDIKCHVCGCDGVAMAIDGGHGVSWCEDGHVVAYGDNFSPKQVFDFKDDAPPVPMRGIKR
jgi:hypothetical protein